MILFDAHVHIYDIFNLNVLIDSAFRNFYAAIKSMDKEQNNCSCYLLLTESGDLDHFTSLRTMAASEDDSFSNRWIIEDTQENCSIRVSHPDYPAISLFIVAGRQIVTAERLELLALFTEEKIPENMTLETGVKQICNRGGLPICAWGAGKWLGKRGEILSDFLQTPGGTKLYLGDSGGRPAFWPASKLLQIKAHSDRIVSGTDPLSLVGEDRRVGSFGGYLAAKCSHTTPAARLKELLSAQDVTIKSFGKSLSPYLFIKNQLALRLKR